MSVYEKKELQSPNGYYSSTQTCEGGIWLKRDFRASGATRRQTGKPWQKDEHNTIAPPVEGESEVEEELRVGKKLLKRVKEMNAEAEKAIEELGSVLQNITVATNELKKLGALAGEKQTELRQGLQLAESYKQEASVEQLRVSNEHKKEVDDTKRPLLKKIKGLFGSRKSTKRKKESQAPPLKATYSQAEMTSEANTNYLGFDYSFDDAQGPQREEFGTERRAFRRRGSSGEVSSVSLGTRSAFPYRSRRGSLRSLPTFVGFFSDEFEDPGDFKGNLPPRRKSNASCPGKMPYVIHDQIEITKHPKSQTAKEGSRVQFTCKVDKKKTNVIYQWYKDGVELHGQNNSTLVLDNVDLRDFGLYMCYLYYDYSPEEGVESSCATLNVIPQNGKNLKRLGQLDMTTRHEIACLLGKRNVGLGGVTQVAAKYGMTSYDIVALDNYMEPGKAVLEYLMASKPDLTVYSFCKTLKRKEFNRFDIVRRLEDHISFSKETNEAFAVV